MGLLVSPAVAYLYMEEVEDKALNSLLGMTLTHWFSYVNDTWVNIQVYIKDSGGRGHHRLHKLMGHQYQIHQERHQKQPAPKTGHQNIRRVI